MKLSDRVRPDVEAAPWVIEEIKKLQAERDALLVEVERLKRVNYDMAGDLTVLRATKQMQAAIDAARGEK